MKGTKMKIKRILSAIIILSILSSNVLAFTSYKPETQTDTEQNQTAQEQQTPEIAPGLSGLLPLKQEEYRFELFRQILDAYVENHLYDFTHEDVFYNFFYDFLKDNPMYFELVMDYILGTMDNYSAYYSAKSGFLSSENVSNGFGVTLKQDDKGVYIESVIELSQADEAGLCAGDRFVNIAGVNVDGLPFDAVSIILSSYEKYLPKLDETQLSAEEKNKVRPCPITVNRDGENITFELTKGPMSLGFISSYIDDNDEYPSAYISLTSFAGEETVEEFTNLVTNYANNGIQYLTIDLRDNGGGVLDLSLAMMECFIPKDEIICYYVDKTLEEPKPVYSTTDHVTFKSITILVNENTASAAELFASILQTKKLAKIVGKKTFGKSLGQSVFALANGDTITITSYQMLNEKLESYDGIGIIPDLEIDNVEMCYTLPSLLSFNHENYVEIKEGVYSDVTKALEDRLAIMGLLFEKDADGIFDEKTKSAVYILQVDKKLNPTGYVDHDTVTKITNIINNYKSYTYYDDSQYDAAMIIHHSFSQGKRLKAERERLAKEQSQMIKERDAALEAEIDRLDGITAEEEARKAEKEAQKNEQNNQENKD